MAHQTVDPSRVGGLIETAHALLAGLDPSDEMAFALSAGKLWSVHLNDQNGLKFDQDKSFGGGQPPRRLQPGPRAGVGEVLRHRPFHRPGREGHADAEGRGGPQAPGQQPGGVPKLVEKVRSFPADVAQQCVADRDYEALEFAVLAHLMGK